MKAFFTCLFLFAVFNLLPAAELTIPRFELVTLGRTENDEFGLVSAVSADFNLNNGPKFGLNLDFSFDLENNRLNNAGSFEFGTAKAVIRDLFNLPLDMTYFVGRGDAFCTGDEFNANVGTNYRGLFYFPDGIGGNISRRYDGIYRAEGTGFSFAFTKWNLFIPMLYLYQNYSPADYLESSGKVPFWSGDLRLLVNQPMFRLEAFGGISWKDSARLRGGILTHFRPGRGVEFLFQGGITGWDLEQDLTIDNFFFLLEPRFTFGIFGIYTTMFFHPVIYQNIKTAGEQGKVDLNLKFFAKPFNTEFYTGIETNIKINIVRTGEFYLYADPYVSFNSGGIKWDAKLRFNLLSLDHPEQLFEIFIGINTSL